MNLLSFTMCLMCQNNLEINNAFRARERLPPMEIDERLENTAKAHAMWMAANDRMTHYPNGRNPRMRAQAYGFPVDISRGDNIRDVNENIAVGNSSPWNGWMNSWSHRETILSKRYNVCGFGIAYSRSGVAYWCAVYGRVNK
jgi:uncharacterized protein YkwD